MIRISDKSKCVGCHACYSSCPCGCLSMKEDGEGFLYPSINEKQCINCGKCEHICPVMIRPAFNDYDEVCLAAYSRNDEMRHKSSSGGVFSVLAEAVINSSGIVFGAAFDNEFQVHHVQATTIEELARIRGSKYVQSRIEDTYRATKAYLESGRMVYFSGTPCQIDGLNNYLSHKYENLITQDIICHGVPAPFVWKKYLEQVKANLQSDIKDITFRDKTFGWRRYSLKIDGENGTHEMSNFLENPMMRAYLRDVCLRPSCYKCPSKGVKRSSDITLADFWNVSDYIEKLDDDKGIDLVICHSEKGCKLLKTVSKDLVSCKVDDRAARENIPMNSSPHLPQSRNEFIHSLNMESFSDAVDKYCTIPLVERIQTKVKLILKRISRRK